jgi:hypothetical protein
MDTRKKDFFISYTKDDLQWAAWIAGVLEAKGKSVVIQAWDFKPGESFVLDMDAALRVCEKVIAVLSEKYLLSYNCRAEWSVAYEKGNLIPVRIEAVKPDGLLSTTIYIDLAGLEEAQAQAELLIGLQMEERPGKGFHPAAVAASSPLAVKLARYPGALLPPNNLPAADPHFTGREAILEAIHAAFATGKQISLIQTLKGLGGIGKTAIAKAYAFRYEREYKLIVWVNAETETTIQQTYSQFAHANRLIGPDTNEPEAIRDAVKTWMTQNGNWLFVFDNAEDAGLIANYRPAATGAGRHILITSRNPNWQRFATTLDIQTFTPQEAADFLTAYTGLSSVDARHALAGELGYLPLALEQAAAYICANGISYQDYLDLFKESAPELLKENPDEALQQTVAATWNISISKIGSGSARQLLNLCAFLAPDNIHTRWFADAKDRLPYPLQ